VRVVILGLAWFVGDAFEKDRVYAAWRKRAVE
jgi:hypothetical protein